MVEGPVTNRRFSRRAMRQAMLAATALLIAAAVIGGGWYLYRSSATSTAETERRALTDQAQQFAAVIVEPVQQARAVLKDLSTRPGVAAVFAEEDPAAVAQAGQRWIGEFEHALRLRLVRPGDYDLDTTSSPPLGFASLELLRRVEETNDTVSAEAALVGQPDAHVVLAGPARDRSGALVGLLHVALDPVVIEQALERITLDRGYLELRQSAGANAVVLGSRGSGPPAGEPVVVSVPDTRWNIAYWPAGGAAVTNSTLPLGPGTGIGVILLLLLGAGYVFYRRRANGGPAAATKAGGNVTYQGAVKAIMEGAHPGMEKLVPNLPRYGAEKPIRPVSQGMEGADITQVARRSDLQKPAAAKPAASEPVTPVPPAQNEQPKAAAKPAPPPETPPPPAAASAPPQVEITPGIFRAYDIRGVVGKTLTAEIVELIGRAVGSEVAAAGGSSVVVGRDGRTSSPELGEALMKGINAAGCNVVDVGMVPTPLLYFATHHLDVNNGVMVTGSHNPAEYNGLKIVLDGEALSEDRLQGIYQRIQSGEFASGQGTRESSEIIADYVRRVSEDIPVALGGALRLVVDCGNGVAGVVAPQLLRALGHDVTEIYCEVDGKFPNHHPDPSQPENLETLIATVSELEADMGLAFDGDGDRLGVVDAAGNIIWPDRQLMLLAQDVLSRNAGAPIIFDVKCSRHLKEVIEAAGGSPVMWRTGHSLIKRKMKEMEAPLAGEMSGHIFFKERWYGFDDAMYTAARLLEIMVAARRKPVEVFGELPQGVSTPELRVKLPEDAHGSFMSSLKEKMAFEGAEVIDIDGFRVEFRDGWGLIRPSNTSPVLVLRFEADDSQALERIQGEFRDLLKSINPDLELPF